MHTSVTKWRFGGRFGLRPGLCEDRNMPRLRRVVLTVLSGALLASLVSAPIATAKPSAQPGAPIAKGTVIPASLFGMHVYNAEQGNWPNVPVGSLRLWDNQTAWANIETTQGAFNWTALDTSVATAKKNGVNDILMVLAGTPAWATDDSSPTALPVPGAAGMPRNLAWWDNWVTQVVTRYKGKITSYQPWNEANLSTFSTATPDEMADLTKRAYDIIKAIDPAATVVAPSTGTRLGGPFMKFYPAFLAGLKARGWPVDVWAAHTYPASLGTPVDRAGLAAKWIAVLRSSGAPNLPLWDTENNFGLKGPGPLNPDVDLEGAKAGDWVARTYLDSLRLGISRVYWYRWEPYNDLWGIQMNTGTPGAEAFGTLQDWIVGATYRGCTQKAAQVNCSFTKAGKAFSIVYTSNGRIANFKLPRSFAKVCELNGVCTPLNANKVRTNGPVLLTS
jgi:hypothetical protein